VASEPDALLRIPFDKGNAEEPEQLVALPVCQWRERRLEDLIDRLVPLSQRRFALGGDSVPDRPPRSGDTLNQSSLHEADGERAEGLVGLERHFGERVSRRVGASGDGAEGIPLGKGRSDFSQLAVHPPVVTVLELLDHSAQVLESSRHTGKIQRNLSLRI